MRRSYRQERYLGILEQVRAAIPTRPSPRTSSWASPARPSGISPTPWTPSGQHGSPARSRSSIRSGRARPPRPCPARYPRAWVAERYGRLTALVAEIAGEGDEALSSPRGRGCSWPRGGTQGQRHPPGQRAGAGQPARPLRALGDRAAARRRGDHGGDQGGAALPIADTPPLTLAAHPGRGRVAGPQGWPGEPGANGLAASAPPVLLGMPAPRPARLLNGPHAAAPGVPS